MIHPQFIPLPDPTMHHAELPSTSLPCFWPMFILLLVAADPVALESSAKASQQQRIQLCDSSYGLSSLQFRSAPPHSPGMPATSIAAPTASCVPTPASFQTAFLPFCNFLTQYLDFLFPVAHPALTNCHPHPPLAVPLCLSEETTSTKTATCQSCFPGEPVLPKSCCLGWE